MRTKVFVITLITSVALSIFCTYYVTIQLRPLTKKEEVNQPVFAEVTSNNSSYSSCEVDMVRIPSNRLVKPLLYADMDCESEKLIPLKNKLRDLLQGQTKAGLLSEASVYLKESNTADWMCVNPTSTFQPGSVVKVAIMMTILKMVEKDPALMETSMTLTQRAPVPEATITGPALELGKSYKIRDLLNHMIVYSDNDATMLLTQAMDPNVFINLFRDLGMSVPDVNENFHRMSAKEVARLFRVLYNASFLTEEASEYAMSLLTKTAFRDGLSKKLPTNLTIARKFGERFDEEQLQNFHEVGMVYLEGRPYLLSIMTKGKDKEKLHQVVADISEVCFKYMSGKGL